MFSFQFRYLLLTITLFIIEILIAAFMHDAFIRPIFGDYLVVMLIYCAIHTVVYANFRILCLTVLGIAYTIEITQYFHLIEILGLKHSRPAQWILGNGFSWGDMLAYTLGVATIWKLESKEKRD